MASLEHRLPPVYNYSTCYTEEFSTYSFYILWFYFLYISFVFYGSIKAITEAIHRWFHFLSTASVWLYYLVYERVFTRSCTSLLFTRLMHQPLLTRHCTNHLFTKLWLIRGEAHQYIDPVVCFNTKDSHHRLKEHTIPYVFRAPRHDSLVLLN